MNIEKIIREGNGTIVDVRTPEEFTAGHVAGSVNIPLGELQYRTDELKKLEHPLILCCASGGRSFMAAGMLAQQGIDCHDAGSWLNIKYHQSETV